MPKKHPRVGDRVGAKPQCLYCPKESKAHFDPPGKSLIACKGLSLHTSQVGGGQACGEEYAAAGYMQNGKLKSHLSSPASKSLRAPNVSSREVGLIETEDGPLGPILHPVCQKVDHSLLNNQTLYDGRRPPLLFLWSCRGRARPRAQGRPYFYGRRVAPGPQHYRWVSATRSGHH